MDRSSEVVLDRERVREVVGVFHSRKRLNDAVQELLLAGFDRADIDVMAGLDAVQQRLGFVFVASEELPDIPQVPRRPFIAPEDVTLTQAMTVGIFAFIGAAVAVLIVFTSGGSTASTGLAALLGAVLAGGVAARLMARAFRRAEDEALEAIMAARGIALWVRMHSDEREDQARRILERHGGSAVRVHEIDLAKRTEDIPLASLQPDPWLGGERLRSP
jgi:hypothetical protein